MTLFSDNKSSNNISLTKGTGSFDSGDTNHILTNDKIGCESKDNNNDAGRNLLLENTQLTEKIKMLQDQLDALTEIANVCESEDASRHIPADSSLAKLAAESQSIDKQNDEHTPGKSLNKKGESQINQAVDPFTIDLALHLQTESNNTQTPHASNAKDTIDGEPFVQTDSNDTQASNTAQVQPKSKAASQSKRRGKRSPSTGKSLEESVSRLEADLQQALGEKEDLQRRIEMMLDEKDKAAKGLASLERLHCEEIDEKENVLLKRIYALEGEVGLLQKRIQGEDKDYKEVYEKENVLLDRIHVLEEEVSLLQLQRQGKGKEDKESILQERINLLEKEVSLLQGQGQVNNSGEEMVLLVGTERADGNLRLGESAEKKIVVGNLMGEFGEDLKGKVAKEKKVIGNILNEQMLLTDADKFLNETIPLADKDLNEKMLLVKNDNVLNEQILVSNNGKDFNEKVSLVDECSNLDEMILLANSVKNLEDGTIAERKEFENKIKELENKSLSFLDQIKDLEKAKVLSEESRKNLESTISDLEIELSSLRNEKVRMVTCLEELEERNSSLEKQMDEMITSSRMLQGSVDEFKTKAVALEEEIKNKDIVLGTMQGSLDEFKTKAATLEDEINNKDIVLGNMQGSIEEFKTKTTALEDEIKNKDIVLSDMEKLKTNFEHEKAAFIESISSLETEKQVLEDKIKSLEDLYNSKLSEKEMHLLDNVTKLENETRELSSSLKKTDSEKAALEEKLKSSLDDWDKERAALRLDIDKLSVDRDALEEKIKIAEMDKLLMTNNIAEIEKEKANWNEKHQNVLADFEGYKTVAEKRLSKYEEEIKVLKDSVTLCEKEKLSQQEKADKMAVELELLRAKVEDLQGNLTSCKVEHDEGVKKWHGDALDWENQLKKMSLDKEALEKTIEDNKVELGLLKTNIDANLVDYENQLKEMSLDRERLERVIENTKAELDLLKNNMNANMVDSEQKTKELLEKTIKDYIAENNLMKENMILDSENKFELIKKQNVTEVDILHNSIVNLENKIREITLEKAELESAVVQNESVVETLKTDQNQMVRKLQDMDLLVDKVDILTKENLNLEKRVKDMDNSRETWENEKSNLESEIKDGINERNSLVNSLEELRNNISSLEKDLADEKAVHKSEIAKIMKEKDMLIEANTNLEANISEAGIKHGLMAAKNDVLEASSHDFNLKISDLQKDVADLKIILADFESEKIISMEKYKNSFDSISSENDLLTSKVKLLEDDYNGLLQTQVDLLDKLEVAEKNYKDALIQFNEVSEINKSLLNQIDSLKLSKNNLKDSNMNHTSSNFENDSTLSLVAGEDDCITLDSSKGIKTDTELKIATDQNQHSRSTAPSNEAAHTSTIAELKATVSKLEEENAAIASEKKALVIKLQELEITGSQSVSKTDKETGKSLGKDKEQIRELKSELSQSSKEASTALESLKSKGVLIEELLLEKASLELQLATQKSALERACVELQECQRKYDDLIKDNDDWQSQSDDPNAQKIKKYEDEIAQLKLALSGNDVAIVKVVEKTERVVLGNNSVEVDKDSMNAEEAVLKGSNRVLLHEARVADLEETLNKVQSESADDKRHLLAVSRENSTLKREIEELKRMLSELELVGGRKNNLNVAMEIETVDFIDSRDGRQEFNVALEDIKNAVGSSLWSNSDITASHDVNTRSANDRGDVEVKLESEETAMNEYANIVALGHTDIKVNRNKLTESKNAYKHTGADPHMNINPSSFIDQENYLSSSKTSTLYSNERSTNIDASADLKIPNDSAGWWSSEDWNNVGLDDHIHDDGRHGNQEDFKSSLTNESNDVDFLVSERKRYLEELVILKRELDYLQKHSKDFYSRTFNEPTELEYLKNILFEYMMGKETKTLSKVICTVLKFNEAQTSAILVKEDNKTSILSTFRAS